MKKIDLTDITFIIPIRLDSIDRLENLLISTKFLMKYFNTNIVVFESDHRNKHLIEKVLSRKINYIFYKDYDPVFHRTRFINQIVRSIDTSYIAIWDSDVIAKKEQIITSFKLLESKMADFVYPYTSKLLNVPESVKNIFYKSLEMSILDNLLNGLNEMYGPVSVGGAFFANRLKYLEAGLENETFYGWGFEDGERFERWNKLGYQIIRTDGVLFHLCHERNSNSFVPNEIQNLIKTKEIMRIKNMSKNQLREEIGRW